MAALLHIYIQTMHSRRVSLEGSLVQSLLCVATVLFIGSLAPARNGLALFAHAAPCADFLLDSFADATPLPPPAPSDAEAAVTNKLKLTWQHSAGSETRARLATAPADDPRLGTYYKAGSQTALKLEVGKNGGKEWFLTPLGCKVPMKPYVGISFTITTTYLLSYGVSILTGNCPASVNTSSDPSLSPTAPGIAYWQPVRHGDATFVGVNPNISDIGVNGKTLFTENVFIDLQKLYGDYKYAPRLSHIAFEGFPPDAQVWIKDVALVGSHEKNCTAEPPKGISLFDPGANRFHYAASIDWTEETPMGYVNKLGGKVIPTLWNSYLVFGRGFPRADLLHTWASQILEVNSTESPIFNLFAMPNEQATPDDPAVGLERVTDYALEGLAEACRQLNLRGVPVVVTLGHEPNGFWYSYAHQPANYTAFFRRAYKAIKRRAGKGTAVALSLNSANIYWSDALPYDPLLDTNNNGVLDPQDNPYSPYFPGRDYVDWVGVSLYFYGIEFPWGVNEDIPPTRFVDSLLGKYGTNGHAPYSLAADNNLPFFIFETSAAYFPAANASGPTRAQLMAEWRKQVYDPATFKAMPLLRGIQWFEHRHHEEGTGRDYRAASTPSEAEALVKDLEAMGVMDGKDGAARIAQLGEGFWGDIKAYSNVPAAS